MVIQRIEGISKQLGATMGLSVEICENVSIVLLSILMCK